MLARKTLMLDNNSAIARKIEDDSNKNNNSIFFKNLASESIDTGNWDLAIFACNKVLAFDGSDGECASWKMTAVENQADQLVDKATRLLREGFLARAIKVTKEIEEMMGRGRTAKVQALKSAIVDRTQILVQQYADDGYFGVAW